MNREIVPDTVTVAVCTFRRESLTATLMSIAVQDFALDRPLYVIVADNDTHDARRESITELGAALGLDLLYVHAPAQNISTARNACLDACRTRWLAFIDDDEEATKTWLKSLFQAKNDAHIVFGVCEAVYPSNAPKWMIAADFHSNRISGKEWNGYTSNVLIDANFTTDNKLKFATELGLTGGEDTLFFFQAHTMGAKFGYCTQALVKEPVARSRLNMKWAIQRNFRAGQVHHMILSRQGKGISGPITAGLKATVLLVSLPFFLKSWRAQLIRMSLHFGVLARAVGLPIFKEYSSNPKWISRIKRFYSAEFGE